MLLIVVLGSLVQVSAAAADAPVADYGWWAQASVGGAGSATTPGAPTDGLYVETSPGGDLAVSAVSFPVSDGSPATLTLRVYGNPVLTTAPRACALTSAFVPVQAGAWANRPTYDCGKPVAGAIAPDGKQVSFDLRALAVDGFVRVALLAGGPADRVGFDQVTASEPAAPSAPTPPTSQPTSASVSGSTPAPPFTAPPALLAGPPPVSGLSGSVAPPAFVAPVRPLYPPANAAPAPQTVVPVARTSDAHSIRRTVAAAAGVGLLLLVLLYWADGFGGLPLRTGLGVRPAAKQMS